MSDAVALAKIRSQRMMIRVIHGTLQMVSVILLFSRCDSLVRIIRQHSVEIVRFWNLIILIIHGGVLILPIICLSLHRLDQFTNDVNC